MKKILIFLAILLFTLQIVSAANVCIVADFGKNSESKPISKCVDIDEKVNGYDLIQKSGLNVVWTPNTTYGHMICKINDEGTDVSGQYCAYNGEFWNIVLNRNGEWLHLPIGLDAPGPCWNYDENSWNGHYCTKDGDVLGFAFGSEGYKPNMFKINATRIYVDGKIQNSLSEDGGKIKDVLPGSTIELKLRFENVYSGSTDIGINSISADGTLEEVDNGADLVKSINDFDLGADREETKILNFTVPLNVESQDRLLKLEISAIDDAGIRYSKTLTYDVKIGKKEHDVKILDASMNKASYSCGENSLLSLSISNLGANKEDVGLSIYNKELSLNINERIKMGNTPSDPSEQYNNRFNVFIPAGIDKKTYPVTITANYGANTTATNVDIVVNNCDGSKIKTSEDNKTKTTEEPSVNSTAQQTQQTGEISNEAALSSGKTASTTKVIKQVPNKNAADYAIIGIVVLLVVVIAALAAMFFVLRK